MKWLIPIFLTGCAAAAPFGFGCLCTPQFALLSSNGVQRRDYNIVLG